MRSIAAELRLPPATVHRALRRLAATPAYVNGHLNVTACERLLIDALEFVAPAAPGAETRGVPTAWAAPPLSAVLTQVDPLPPVWPDPLGETRGVAVTPLHPCVPSLARADREMYELLALIDGLRIGDTRVREIAREQLRRWILGRPEHAA